MAIKVGGTTVVDDSRQLSNIASVDATTVAALGAAGVGGGGGVITATADGAISAGDAVSLQTNGTVKVITETITALGTPTISSDREIHGNGTNGYEHLYWFPTAGVYVYFTQFGSDGKCWIFPFDHSTNTRGSFTTNGQTVISGSLSQDLSSAFDPTTGKFFLCWQFSGSVRYISGIVLSNGTIDLDANGEANFTTIRTSDNCQDVVVSETDNNFRMVYARSNGLYVKQFSVNSNGISAGVGGTQNLASTSASGVSAAWDSDNNRFMVAFRNDGAEDRGTAVYFTFSSAGSFTKHQETNWENTAYQNIQHTDIAYNPYYNRFIVFYDKQSAGSRIIPLTISGTSFSVGTSAQVTATHPLGAKQLSYDPATNKTVCMYVNSGGVSFNAADVSSTTPSMDGAFTISGTTNSSECMITYNTTDKLFATVFHNGGAYLASVTTSSASSNNTDWIGFASEAISDTASGDILVVGSTDENQTGLTIGSTYYVQPDGTLGTSTINAIKAGRALSATKLLITEGNA